MARLTDGLRWIARGPRRRARCTACGHEWDAQRRFISGPGVYACEACLRDPAEGRTTAGAPGRCSFCRRDEDALAGVWPELTICAACLERAREVLAEDDQAPRTRHQRGLQLTGDLWIAAADAAALIELARS